MDQLVSSLKKSSKKQLFVAESIQKELDEIKRQYFFRSVYQA